MQVYIKKLTRYAENKINKLERDMQRSASDKKKLTIRKRSRNPYTPDSVS